MCFGRRFVSVTNCYAVKFILTYDGSNPAVLRLQMRLMGWGVEIVHRSSGFLTDADYWLRLDADLCYNPLFCTYLRICTNLRSTHPLPRICLCSQRTCHITGGHALLLRPRTPPSPQPQEMPLPLQQGQPLSCRVQSHAFQITQLSLVHFPPPSPTQWKWTAGNSTTLNTMSLLSEHCTLSGPSTHSTLAILF
jgi:hypothetical protein